MKKVRAKRRGRPRKARRYTPMVPTVVDQQLIIDLYDNAVAQLERLEALAELLECANDTVEARVMGGVGLLLKDIHGRMKGDLEAALKQKRWAK